MTVVCLDRPVCDAAADGMEHFGTETHHEDLKVLGQGPKFHNEAHGNWDFTRSQGGGMQ